MENTERGETPTRSDHRVVTGRFGQLATSTMLYLVAGIVAREASLATEPLAMCWPQLGIAWAIFFVLPRRDWPVSIILMTIVAILLSRLSTQGDPIQIAYALVQILGGLGGALAFRRFSPAMRPLEDLPSLQIFLSVALGVVAITGTLTAMIAIRASGELTGPAWASHYGAAALGILLFALPAKALFRISATTFRWRPSPDLVIAGSLALAVILFSQYAWASDQIVPGLLSVPFLVWIAIRRPATESITLLMIVSSLNLLPAVRNAGFMPNSIISQAQYIIWLQSFLTIRAGTILMLTASMVARGKAERISAGHAAHLQSMVEAVPDAIITIDERGIVTFFSAAAERMFLYRAEEIIGRNVKILMPMPYRGEHDSYLARYLDTGERRIIGVGRVVVAQRKDGTTFPIELAVGQAMLAGKHVFTGLIRDISEKQEITRRLHEVQSDLLHVSRLSAMGELASALAHELNQPLTAINNYLLAARQLLKRDPMDLPKSIDIISKSIDQAVRAGQIIQRLRQFVDRREGERESIDITTVVEESSALAFVGLKERGIRVKIERPDGLSKVAIDKIQIQQVLINLIRNAVDAMEGSERRDLTVKIKLIDQEVDIQIIDTGSGIATEIAAKLFQPFTTTKAAGMGVGLSISRTIVENHDGRLWHEPNPAGGTIFHLVIPLESDQAPSR